MAIPKSIPLVRALPPTVFTLSGDLSLFISFARTSLNSGLRSLSKSRSSIWASMDSLVTGLTSVKQSRSAKKFLMLSLMLFLWKISSDSNPFVDFWVSSTWSKYARGVRCLKSNPKSRRTHTKDGKNCLNSRPDSSCAPLSLMRNSSVNLSTAERSSIDYSVMWPIWLKTKVDESKIDSAKILISVANSLSVEPSPSVSNSRASTSSLRGIN